MDVNERPSSTADMPWRVTKARWNTSLGRCIAIKVARSSLHASSVWMCSSPTSSRAVSARAVARLASDPVERSSTTSTVRPSAIKRSTRWEPTNPAPPTTSTPPVRRSRAGGSATTPGAPSLGGGDSGISELLTGRDLALRSNDGANDDRLWTDGAGDDRVLDDGTGADDRAAQHDRSGDRCIRTDLGITDDAVGDARRGRELGAWGDRIADLG